MMTAIGLWEAKPGQQRSALRKAFESELSC